MAICEVCGTTFDNTKKPWFRKCYGCWKREREAELHDAAYDEGYTAGRRDGYQRGFDDGLLSAPVNVSIPPQFDGEFLMAMMKLAHPDMHPPSRQELATRVTQEINRLRSQM